MTLTMARPKKKPAPVGRPKTEEPKRSLASLKGSESYAAWFDGLVDFSHLPASILIEHALREWAENHGYGKPQPKR
jgi:hypothetical protein